MTLWWHWEAHLSRVHISASLPTKFVTTRREQSPGPPIASIQDTSRFRYTSHSNTTTTTIITPTSHSNIRPRHKEFSKWAFSSCCWFSWFSIKAVLSQFTRRTSLTLRITRYKKEERLIVVHKSEHWWKTSLNAWRCIVLIYTSPGQGQGKPFAWIKW